MSAFFGIVRVIVQYSIGILVISMFIRAIASMFRIDERFAIIRFLARITDPFIEPWRRILRPVGVFDLSFFVAWFVLTTVGALLAQSLPG